jgi:hypothetical protein
LRLAISKRKLTVSSAKAFYALRGGQKVTKEIDRGILPITRIFGEVLTKIIVPCPTVGLLPQNHNPRLRTAKFFRDGELEWWTNSSISEELAEKDAFQSRQTSLSLPWVSSRSIMSHYQYVFVLDTFWSPGCRFDSPAGGPLLSAAGKTRLMSNSFESKFSLIFFLLNIK